MPLNPSPNPVFKPSVPALTTSSVAHPDTWNPIHQQLLDNTVVVNTVVEQNKLAVDQTTQQLKQRLDSVEATSSVSVQKAVNLDWLYRNNAISFEMFVLGYTLIDLAPVAVVQGVNGDDSLDVADTSALRAGEFYVLSDPTAVDGAGKISPVSALVQVQSVLSGVRVRLTANMARTWGPSAFLLRSSIKVLGASNAAAVPGDIYLTRSINVGTDLAGGAVVIRRTLNSGLARLYYRDGYQPTWKECGWSQRRTGGDVPAGFADYEYILPMRGDGWLRLDVAGEAMTIAHIVALGQATGLGGFINPDLRPTTPIISAPVAAATNLMERPTLAVASYATPSGNAQAGVQFQLSTTATFTAVLHDSGTLAAGLSYSVPAGVLNVGITYYWRARVQDVAGLWSDYSIVSSFTTAASFAYVVTPGITGPAANAVDVPEQPTLASSAFAMQGGTDTHAASQWRIRTAAGTYAAAVWDSGTDATNRLTAVVPAGKLSAGQQTYYVQVRHQGAAKGWSEWSTESKLTTKAQFANVIGIALLTTGGGSGTWARIDENGSTKVTDTSFFSSHPIYGAVQDVMIDSQWMVRIPAFYIKTGLIAAGVNAGKRAWWISDQPLAGYFLHPAFMNAGLPLQQFWVGKYQASLNAGGNYLQSIPGVVPLGERPLAQFRSLIEARNTGGVSGFSLWNIYQVQAIQLLALIEMGGADSQVLIGRGNVDGVNGSLAVTNSSIVEQAKWRGVMGLWGNCYQAIDGFGVSAGKLKIWDKNGNRTWVTPGQAIPANGWPVTFSTDSGANYDLSVGFFPATTDANAGNGSTGDNFLYSGSSGEVMTNFGGTNGSGSGAGLFCMLFYYLESWTGTDFCARIAKI